MKEQFEVGDKVRAWGIDGVVIEVRDHGDNSVKVQIEGGRRDSFSPAGMYLYWHKEPSLFLVEKAKKEEPIVQWFSVLAKHKNYDRPKQYTGTYKNEDDFLNTVGFANDNFDWIKLAPMCKTQGNKLVEE